MMHKKSLKKNEGLLLTGVFWDPADTHIFPVLLSGLACSSLSVSAFFAPPGPHPDEVCFFVPEEQMDVFIQGLTAVNNYFYNRDMTTTGEEADL